MKKNSLKVLLLSTILVGTMASCGDEPTSSTPSSDPTSVTEGSSIVTPDESSTTTVSPDSTTSEAPAQPTMKVELNRKIYLTGETELDCSYVGVWYNALNDYREVTSKSFEIPTGVTGPCKAKVISGQRSMEVDIEIYNTAKEAAEAHPLSEAELEAIEFRESRYVNVSKKQVVNDTYVDELGVVRAAVDKSSVSYADGNVILFMKNPTNYTWASNLTFIFTDAAGLVTSTLDPTRHTVPHENDSYIVPSDSPEGYDTVVQEGEVLTYSTFNIPSYDDGTGSTTAIHNSNYQTEMILDSEGYICYVGVNYNNGSYTHILPTDTDKWYSHSKYADVRTNPAFVFGPEYDPDDPVHKYDFEKVIPIGGTYAINANNVYSYTTERGMSAVDYSWAFAANLPANTNISRFAPTQELRANEYLENSRVFYRNSSVNGFRYSKSMVVFTEADTFQRYGYYYALALQSEDAAALAYRDTVYNALIYQLADSIASEKVLADYYASLTTVVLDTWHDMVVVK